MAARRAEQRRKRTRRTDVIVFSAAAGLLLLTGLYLWLLGGTRPPSVAAIGGPFVLTQDDGRVVTAGDFRGAYMLVYFGYTSCPDVCPTTLSAISDAVEILGSRADRLRPVFITVDPRRDVPAAVRAYVHKFSPAIVGLSGTEAEIKAVEREYRITSDVHTAAGGTSDYSVDHTAILYLMAPDGSYLAPLSALASGPELASRLAAYLVPRSDLRPG